MTQPISLRPLHINDPEIQQATQLYVKAFPSCERREVSEWLKIVEQEESFTLFAIFLNETFVGIISCWNFNEFIYIEHFAVNSQIRGNGVGSKTITALKEYYDSMPFILEVEPPCDDLTLRRVKFYQRQGFHLCESKYLQPPYKKGDEWFELKLMTTQQDFLVEHIDDVISCIYENVYHTFSTHK